MTVVSRIFLLFAVFPLICHGTCPKDEQCAESTALVGMLVPQQASNCGKRCLISMGLPCKCSCDTGAHDSQVKLRTSENPSPVSCGMTCCAPEGMPTCTCKCGEGIETAAMKTTTPEPPKECRVIPVPNTGTYAPTECTSAPQQVGATCNLTCPYGYEKVGNMLSICLPTGIWSGFGECLVDRALGDHLVHHLAWMQDRNILFVVDASGSVRYNYGTELKLVKSIARAFPLKSGKRYMGVITFDHEAWVRVPINKFVGHNKTCDFIQAAHCAKYSGRRTDIAVALKLAKDHISRLKPPVGDLSKTIIVLLTDGNGGKPQKVAKEIKQEGGVIITIGVGAYNEEVLQDVASESTLGNKLFYGINKFKAFPEIIHEINKYGKQHGIHCPKTTRC